MSLGLSTTYDVVGLIIDQEFVLDFLEQPVVIQKHLETTPDGRLSTYVVEPAVDQRGQLFIIVDNRKDTSYGEEFPFEVCGVGWLNS